MSVLVMPMVVVMMRRVVMVVAAVVVAVAVMVTVTVTVLVRVAVQMMMAVQVMVAAGTLAVACSGHGRQSHITITAAAAAANYITFALTCCPIAAIVAVRLAPRAPVTIRLSSARFDQQPFGVIIFINIIIIVTAVVLRPPGATVGRARRRPRRLHFRSVARS